MTIRSRPRFPDWQNEFEAAVIEFDPLKLPQMVEVAENAIFTRWAKLMDTLTRVTTGKRSCFGR